MAAHFCRLRAREVYRGEEGREETSMKVTSWLWLKLLFKIQHRTLWNMEEVAADIDTVLV